MKLFTKEIDNKLFSQYSMGADLENQKVVAKIFNPYGRGRWYLLNSDPEDRDYLWAIVEMDGEVEIGSVSRSQLENIKIGPYKFPLERDIYFTPVNAAKLYRDLIIKAEDELTGESEGERRAGMDEFKEGGQIDIAQQNKDMLLNYAEELEHHTEEFEEAAKKAENVEPWVVAKIERSTTDLSDVTHYLDSENEIRREYGNGEGEEMAKGGRVMEKGDAVIYDDQTYFITEKDGRVGLVSMRQSAAGSRPPIIDISKIDVDKEITDMYGDKVIIPSKFERGGKINIGTNTKTDSDVYYDRNTKSFYIYVIDGAGSRVNKLEVDSIDDVLKKFPNWKWSEDGRKEFLSEKGKMADGGYVNQYFGKGYEDDAITELKKALPNHKFEKGKNKIIVDGGKYIIYTDEGRYGFIRIYDNGEFAGGIGVERLSEAIEVIKKENLYDIGGIMADGGMLGSVEEIKNISNAITEETGLEKNDGPEYGFVTRLDVERILNKEKYKLLKYKGTFLKNFENAIPLFEEIISDLSTYGWKIIDTRKQKMADGGRVNTIELEREIKETQNKYPKAKVSYSFAKDSTGKGYVIRAKEGSKIVYSSYKAKYGGMMAKGGGVGEPYDSMTKYQLEKEYKKLNQKRDSLRDKYGSFESDEVIENEKEIDKIITLLYGENFSGVGQKFKYASGGEVKFADKVKSIKSSLLKRKKVSPSVQKDYGKTYSPKEAEESAKRIVGASTAKERLMNRMKKSKK